MDVLIVVATVAELEPTLKRFVYLIGKEEKEKRQGTNNPSFPFAPTHFSLTSQVDVLVTGVGMLATTYHLTKVLQQRKYHLAINVGIAGCFSKDIALATVLNIVSEEFTELGAQDGEAFLSVFSLNLLGKDEFPFTNGKLQNPYLNQLKALQDIQNVDGITVNTVHGEEKSITDIQQRTKATVESMEGGAFAYICLLERQPYLQLRAISNYVEKRNRSAWQIPAAIENLNNTLSEIIQELTLTNE